MKSILGLLLGGAVLAASGVAADSPRRLAPAELDNVVAGAQGTGSAVGVGFGPIVKTDTRVAGTAGSEDVNPGTGATNGWAATATFARVDAPSGQSATSTSASAVAPEGTETYQFNMNTQVPNTGGTSTSLSVSFAKSYFGNPLLP